MHSIYYSLALDMSSQRDADLAATYEREWAQSIRSLRRYNSTIPVHLFFYGCPSDSLLREADHNSVAVHRPGTYLESLAAVLPAKAHTLKPYTTLHKVLALRDYPHSDDTQILYVDCDTFFFNDVTLLFDKYQQCSWYGREEPASRRSARGHDASYMNESLMESLAEMEGILHIPPYNTGVCMLNKRIWLDLAALAETFLTYVWRFLVGFHVHGNSLRKQSISPAARAACLPYPSDSLWILDQVAIWFTLGKIPNFTHDLFSTADVALGMEFMQLSPECVMSHYFSRYEREFFARFKPLQPTACLHG